MNERLCRLIGTLMTIGLLIFSSAAWALEVKEEWLAYYDTQEYAERFNKVEVDSAGNAYVVGEPGLLKYGSDGVLKWRVAGRHWSLRTDLAGNSYSSCMNSTTGRYELVKYDTQGTLIWARNDAEQGRAGAYLSVVYEDIQLDLTGNVIVASKVSWVENYSEKSGIRVLKYSQDGTLIWAAWEQPGATQNYVAGLATDPGGDVAVAILDFQTPGYELIKYSANGSKLWSRFINSGFNGPGGQVAADAQGNVFLFSFKGIHKFNGTTGEEVSLFEVLVDQSPQITIDASSSVVASGRASTVGGWVKKLDNDLMPIWEVSLGSKETPMDLATDKKGNVFLAGYDYTAYPPKIVTWIFNPEGDLSFRHLYSGVSYGYGNSLAVLEGQALYVAAYTWGYKSSAYGGVLIKYNIRSAIPPVAEAGENKSIHAGDTVALDGSGSSDDKTPSQNLLYSWSFTSLPAGSTAALTGADTAAPSFTADLPGTYVADLVVTDEDNLSSEPDEVTISSLNAPPNADAGPDQGAYVGEPVALDGSGSNDPDSDLITFSWTLTRRPDGSAAALSGADTIAPTFVPDVPGAYDVELIVDDGFETSMKDEVTVMVITAEDFAETQAAVAINVAGMLPPDSVTTVGNRTALVNFLKQAITALQEGDIAEARLKLQDALGRTDGCALRAAPDSPGEGPIMQDYISNCPDQWLVYPLLQDALIALEGT